ncbi:Cell wall assembly regulator [Oleoguttula sp. CCFEE 5521]
MAPSLGSQWRAFWHTMTSNDRHTSYDSPYRTGNHVPLAQNRHAPLTAGATSALESRADLTSPYEHDLEAGHGYTGSGAPGDSSPKSPHVRTSAQRSQSENEGSGTGEIQMQSFDDGLPPPPPVNHSWKRIDRFLEDNYEELWENLGAPATFNDVNELEHELDCTLPQEVRESLQLHDGQERGGLPTGVVFGCMLLDCEEIQQEWQQWRTVNEAYFSQQNKAYSIPQAPIKAFAGSSSSSAVPVPQAQQSANPHWRQELQDKQDSQPPNAIQKAYAHPAWIPMARDWGGNNIAIDLAPGPTGKWGQVILMGRDYDCKYVISRSWSAFLANVADDMGTSKWFIDEETKELKLREFKQQGVEPAYIDILRWRSDQKYGKRQTAGKRRPNQGLRINPQAGGQQQGSANGYSPYGSPTSATEDRGRSPLRLSGNANGQSTSGKGPATSSPRAHISSPLARVTEEPQSQSQPLRVDTAVAKPDVNAKLEKLVSVDTPLPPQTPLEGEGDGFLAKKPERFSSSGPGREEQAVGGGGLGEEDGDGEMRDVAL